MTPPICIGNKSLTRFSLMSKTHSAFHKSKATHITHVRMITSHDPLGATSRTQPAVPSSEDLKLTLEIKQNTVLMAT